ncbi:MAG: methyltransferase domain-containing protein [Candidatus Lindowbacteria bacterium]|nr:methyltransferase domain-containing protein [Candidatus Lindowbacteria bacterium]
MSEIEKYFDEMAGRFDDYYAERNASLFGRLVHSVLREPGMRRRFDATIRLLGHVRGKRILDAGCGTGVYSIYLSRLGASVCCVDVSEKMLEHTRVNAKAAGVEPAQILQADFMEHDFGEKFDFVLAIGVFDYIPSRRQCEYLARLMLLTKGSVIASFPKLITPQAPLRRLWFVGKKARLYLYTARRVADLGREAGADSTFIDCGPIWTVEFRPSRSNPA